MAKKLVLILVLVIVISFASITKAAPSCLSNDHKLFAAGNLNDMLIGHFSYFPGSPMYTCDILFPYYTCCKTKDLYIEGGVHQCNVYNGNGPGNGNKVYNNFVYPNYSAAFTFARSRPTPDEVHGYTDGNKICYGGIGGCEVNLISPPGNGAYTCTDPNKHVIMRFTNDINNFGAPYFGGAVAGNAYSTDTTYVTTYSYNLCCYTNSYPPYPHWSPADPSCELIDGINQQSVARVGTTISGYIPFYETKYLNDFIAEGDTTFNVIESDGGTGDEVIRQNIPLYKNDYEKQIEFQWTITQEDLAITESGDHNNYRFKIGWMESPDLKLTFCGDGVKDNYYDCGTLSDITENCDNGEDNGDPGSAVGGIYCDSNCNLANTNQDRIWTDPSGSTVSKVRVPSTVFLRYLGNDGNPDPTFDVYETGSPPTTIFTNLGGSPSGSDFVYQWNILQTQIEDKSDDYNNFYFNIDGDISNYLEITFCGDGERDGSDGETCDAGDSNGNICVPPAYNTNCTWCNDSCQRQLKIGSYCGDGMQDNPYEGCDAGDDNGNQSHIYDGTNYCDINCQPQPPGGAYWTNLAGIKISKAEENSQVRLVYEGKAGISNDFTIWEADVFPNSDDPIRDILGTDSNGNRTGVWDIPSLTELSQNTSDFGEFFFEIDNNISGYLEVVVDIGDDPISISIIYPVCGENLNLDETKDIMFKVTDDNSFDIDLFIDGFKVESWKDETTNTFSYTHTFSNAGTTNIRIEVVNDIGDKASAISNVMVIDTSVNSKYVAACIDSPINFEYIEEDYAYFDALNSRAINFTGGISYDIPLSNLYFYWKFSDGRTNPYTDGAEQISYKFYKYFGKKGPNSAELKVEIKP